LQRANDFRFMVQRPFFSDSTKDVSERSVLEFSNFTNNLFENIPHISKLEFDFFESLGKQVIDDDSDNNDDESVMNEIDMNLNRIEGNENDDDDI
jgi:hypothetical protein